MTIRQLAPPLLAAFKIYLLDAQARNYSSATLEVYRARIPPFIDWLAGQGVTEFPELNTAHVREYLAGRTAKVARTTVHSDARALRAFLNFCVREGWLASSPMCAMPRKPKLVKEALTIGELRRVLKRADARDSAIVLVLLDTGLRASELCKLTRKDIDLNTGRATVKAGKGSKDRVVFLGARSLKALLRYWGECGEPPPAGAVFKSSRSQRLTRNALWKILARLSELANVPNLSPHALRRTFAIYSLRAGMDLYTLARLMGHEGIDVLKQYLDLVPDDLEAAHAKFGVTDRL